MFQFMYALLALATLVPPAITWWQRPDLRTPMMVAGVAGGVLEVLGEVWYLQDYWHPGTLLGFPAPEDFVYGFGTTAFTVAVIPLMTGWCYSRPLASWPSQLTRYLAFLTIFSVAMQVGMWCTPLPSIWIACIVFLVMGLVGSWAAEWSRNVLVLALASGIFMVVFSLAGYALGLGVLIDGDAYLRQVYLLAGTASDIRVFGVVPLDEVAWNATRAFGMVGMFMWFTRRRIIAHG